MWTPTTAEKTRQDKTADVVNDRQGVHTPRTKQRFANTGQLCHLVKAPEVKENKRSENGHAHALQTAYSNTLCIGFCCFLKS